MNQRLRLLSTLTMVIVVLATVFSMRSATTAHPGHGQEQEQEIGVSITATDFAFDVPDEIEAGYIPITLVNEGAEPHHAIIVKLNDGVTSDSFIGALESADGADIDNAIIDNGTFSGGPGSTAPDRSSQTIVKLDAGSYMMICLIASPDGTLHVMKGMHKAFEVTGEITGEPPVSDTSITMLDFAFQAPSELPAGEHTIAVTNEGVQPHEAVFFKLNEGVSYDQAVQALMQIAKVTGTPESGEGSPHDMHGDTNATPELASPAPAGPPPFVDIGGVNPIVTGETSWFSSDFEPGTYVITCFVIDPETGQRHIMLGMVSQLTVTG
jgi:hypothetical protein